MVLPEEEAIHADAYIDSLLRGTSGPRPLAPRATLAIDASLQRAADALAELPRFHPSFAFEEALAARLRAASDDEAGGLAEVIRLPRATHAAYAQASFAGIDRRLIVGGAIASGVSLAGIAGVALAWRQRAR